MEEDQELFEHRLKGNVFEKEQALPALKCSYPYSEGPVEAKMTKYNPNANINISRNIQ